MATKRSAQERRRSRRRAVIVFVPTLAGVFVAGTAFAFWSTSGSGSATGASGTTTAVTVTQSGTTPSGLAPGAPAQPVDFTINNPKTSPQYIASVTVAITGVTKISDGTTATGCADSNFALVQPTAINANLPTGNTAFPGSGATVRMLETGVNQDACKNVNVALSFTAA